MPGVDPHVGSKHRLLQFRKRQDIHAPSTGLDLDAAWREINIPPAVIKARTDMPQAVKPATGAGSRTNKKSAVNQLHVNISCMPALSVYN